MRLIGAGPSVWINSIVSRMNPDARRGARVLERIQQHARNSIYFNESDYVLHNPDVAGAWSDPFQHFIKYGIREGRISITHERITDLLGETTARHDVLEKEFLRPGACRERR